MNTPNLLQHIWPTLAGLVLIALTVYATRESSQ